MPRKTSTRRRSSKRPSKMLEIQKQILASNIAQQDRPVLVVPDVPRLRLKRLKSFSIPSKITFDAPGSTQFALFNFDLGQFPDASFLCQIFDQYRVAQLQFDFYLLTAAETPLVTSIDYTDAVVPTTLASILDNESALVTDSSFFQRTLNPKYTMPNSTTGDLASISSAWIPTQIGDSTSPIINDTTWNGLKFGYFTAGSVSALTVVMTAILNFRCRD